MRYSAVLILMFQSAAWGFDEQPKVVLVIHGGSGVLTKEEMDAAGLKAGAFEEALARALAAGYALLQRQDHTSVDAVEAAIRSLEDSPLFNAGKGAAFNSDGRVELDAAIMEGTMNGQGEGKLDPRKRAGAVAAVSHLKNPISAARAVMEMPGSRHVLLVGEGAERFALSGDNPQKYQIQEVSNLYFWTERRLKQIQLQHQRNEDASRGSVSARSPAQGDHSRPSADQRLGTVGAVACGRDKLIVAGTSTGGLTSKLPGRVGDTPQIGTGTYADNRACGVSCTGTGEVFIRHAVAYDVVARMLYGKKSVGDAASATIAALPDEEDGVGGLIALDREGRHAFGMSARSVGMYRGYATEDGRFFVQIYAKDQPKEMPPAATK